MNDNENDSSARTDRRDGKSALGAKDVRQVDERLVIFRGRVAVHLAERCMVLHGCAIADGTEVPLA